jgi:FKBP-type peptidyl-prolyl cis-trans isomerase SlyD
LSANDQGVTLDANHPLAGKTLNFEVEVLEVRQATDQELAHRHAHAQGHDH